MKRAVVAGAGGFIGHHLVGHLKTLGWWVRGVDLKLPEFAPTDADEFLLLDLRDPVGCAVAARDMSDIYQLAANMGGIGFISANHAAIAQDNILINSHMLSAAEAAGAGRFFFSSSACVYPTYRQMIPEIEGLKEEDAFPAQPEGGYGWEKLFAERLCAYYDSETSLKTRVARFHNVYGPLGCFEGGREKAPAAICRKVAEAADGAEIEVWGDGAQARSFMYVSDCVEGIYRLMNAPFSGPVNLGTEEMVTVDGLVDLVCKIAGKRLTKRHDLSQPQGVRGRNSDNSLLRSLLSWEPQVDLSSGMSATYSWIRQQVRHASVEPERMPA